MSGWLAGYGIAGLGGLSPDESMIEPACLRGQPGGCQSCGDCRNRDSLDWGDLQDWRRSDWQRLNVADSGGVGEYNGIASRWVGLVRVGGSEHRITEKGGCCVIAGGVVLGMGDAENRRLINATWSGVHR